MKIIESNTLIAKFMGGVLSTVPNLINLPQTRGESNIYSVKGSEVLPNGTYSVHRLNELEYHKCWNSLMSVVDKIECTTTDNEENSDNFFNVMIEVFECNINGGDISICENGTTKFEATYNAVVKFIENY